MKEHMNTAIEQHTEPTVPDVLGVLDKASTPIPPQLKEVVEKLETSAAVFSTPREILSWFGNHRRTWRQVKRIRRALIELNLATLPDFEGAGFDESLILFNRDVTNGDVAKEIVKGPGPGNTIPPTTPASVGDVKIETASANAPKVEESPLESEKENSFVPADPVHRVARFLSGSKPVSVRRDENISVAMTKMLLQDFSQLPVMQSDRNVDGMISWESLGRKMALGIKPELVRHAIVPHHEVKSEASIFDAIRVIQDHGCVLVRSSDNRIVGVLTAIDISASFEQLSKPFLLLGYIENHLRSLIQAKFDKESLQDAKDPSDASRTIADVSDMTFGEYIRLLENPTNWGKLGLGIERSLFIHQLNEVREIRNDVMHFNPEGIEENDMATLRQFDSFLRSVIEVVQPPVKS